MATAETEQAELEMSPEEQAIAELVERAKTGDRSVLPDLRKLLDNNPHIWQKLGDLATHVEESWVQLISGDNLLLRESVVRTVRDLRDELLGSQPSPLERVLVGRIIVSHLQASHADMHLATREKCTEYELACASKRVERAGKSLTTAVQTLARVRKLLGKPDIALDAEAIRCAGIAPQN